MQGQLRQFAHGRLLAVSRQAGRIDESRCLEADLAGTLGHLRGETVLGSGHAFSDDNAAVIGRLHGNPLNQVLEPDRRLELGKHCRCS
jgi:hypothetical protein